MSNNKNVLVLVHANGKYDVNLAKHTTDVFVNSEFYETLVNEIKSGKYSKIVYFMNLPNCKTNIQITEAYNRDPVLSKLSFDEINKINIFFEGVNLSNEFYNQPMGFYLLNTLAQEGYSFVFGGIYYDICVQSYEQIIKIQNPSTQTFRPPHLSIASQSQTLFEVKNEKKCK